MAFDPIQEDCLRLILEAMRRERIYPLEDPVFIQRGMDAFRSDPASLIKTDRDRSFHLVAKATELIDYRIPFLSDDAEVERLATQAESFLREAAELDCVNWDAQRMLIALDADSNDAYVSYLLDNRSSVENSLKTLEEEADDVYSREFAGDLARRPYLRWLAALASRALIGGQYRLALSVAEESLAYAPQDPADVRHTAMLALAKLESSQDEIERFRADHAEAYQPSLPQFPQRRRPGQPEREPDAWYLIAQLNAAYRELDYEAASRALRTILRAYPRGAQSLFYQAEFPDGVFARVAVGPGTEDELVLALSEATPLLQEGLGTPDSASFSTWIAGHELVQKGLDAQMARSSIRPGIPHLGGEN